MPFITEEIYCALHPEEESIMISTWPEYKAEWNFESEEAEVERAKELVRGIRTLRTDMDVPPSRKAKLLIAAKTADVAATFEQMIPAYSALANASEVAVAAGENAAVELSVPEDAVSVVIPDAVVYMPLSDLVDFEKEKERLTKEKAKLEKELARSKGMLSNEKFLSKAPEAKVAEEKAKLEKYEQMMAEVESRLASLN
jgi:valyl-tRNA synthetase